MTSTTSAASRASSSERSTSARRAGEQPLDRRRAPGWRPCRPCPRSSGGSSATPRSSCGSSALRPRYSMRMRSSSSEEAGAVDRGRGRVLDLLDAVDHREHLVHCHRRGHGRVQRLRADRDVADLVALGEHRVGQPLALRADHERDLAARPARPAARPSRGGERDAPAGQLVDPAHARDRARRRSRPSRPAPPLARRDRPCPGRARRCAAPNASAERSTVPTLPGSLTPHSATHSGPTGAGAQRCG